MLNVLHRLAKPTTPVLSPARYRLDKLRHPSLHHNIIYTAEPMLRAVRPVRKRSVMFFSGKSKRFVCFLFFFAFYSESRKYAGMLTTTSAIISMTSALDTYLRVEK